MLLRYLAFALLLSCSFHGNLWSATYYVDFTSGNDSNDGLSQATAWKNISKIRNAGPSPGDSYLLKRGETWEVNQWYIDFSGAANQTINFGTYGNAGDPLPIISGIGLLPNADDASNWTETATDIWTLSMAKSPGRLFLDGIEYLRASTEADLGINDSEGAFGHWFYDLDNDLLHLSANQNPAMLYSEIKGSLEFLSTLVAGSTHLVFKHLDFRGGAGAALAITGGTDIDIDSCSLGHSGNSGIQLLNSGTQACSNINITNNLFDSDFTFFYGLGSERGCGDGVRMRDGVVACTVSDNVFINWAHNAVELLGYSSGASGVNNNLIFNNKISAPDIPYSHPLGADGLLGKCQFNTFYGNNIHDCRTASQINGNNNWVYNNIIKNIEKSPSKNQATAHAFIIGIYGTNLVSQDNRFDHNLIIDTDESAFLIRGYGLGGLAQNNSIRNNIIYNTGVDPYNNLYNEGTAIVIEEEEELGGNVFQNNLFFSNATGAMSVYLKDDLTYYTAETFNGQNGLDGNTIENNSTGDPQFLNFAGGDYLPEDDSPAVNAGLDTGLEFDYVLNPRLIGTAPDIGPYETGVLGPLPVDWSPLSILAENTQAILKWNTFTEASSSHFEVQRSIDHQRWEKIGNLDARGFSVQETEYRFVDSKPLTGLQYYRLQQFDLNGHFQYSNIVSVSFENPAKFQLARIDPKNLSIISSAVKDWSEVTVSLFDAYGRLVDEINDSPDIHLNALPRGMYFLKVLYRNEYVIFQFIR